MVEYTNPTPNTPRNRGDYDAPHMTSVTPMEDFRTVLINRVSWGAVSSGVAMALVSQFVLNLLGVGVGVTALQYGAAEAYSVDTVSAGAISWWAISGIISALLGGIIAGRMAGDVRESTAGLHGLTSWAVSVVVVASLITAGAGVLIGGTLNVTGIAGTMTLRDGTIRTTAAAPGVVVDNDAAATVAATETTGETDITSTADVTPAPTPTAVARPDGTTAVTIDAATLSTGALISAIALIFGALAAWFGGRLGVVQPTVTVNTVQRKNLH